LAARTARWPSLASAPVPPLAEWLPVARFPRLQHVERWTAEQPFAVEADGLRVSGATARLTRGRVYRTTQVRASQLQETAHTTELEFGGLVLRAEGASAAVATLDTGAADTPSGAFDALRYAAGPEWPGVAERAY
jgi:hypothetical protein